MPLDSALRLTHAPIIEAVLDLHCELASNMDKKAFGELFKKTTGTRYPQQRTIHIHQQNIEFKEGEITSSQGIPSLKGYQHISLDGKQIVQTRFDGFSFNRLAPYSTLDEYLPEIYQCWSEYCEIAKPIRVRRIGLRYINRFLLPLKNGQVSLSQYLKNSPKVPAGIDLKLSIGNLTHFNNVFDAETKNQANIILATQPVNDLKLPVILDIDTFVESDLQVDNWEVIKLKIESLRNLKNALFSFNLKPKCRRLFQ